MPETPPFSEPAALAEAVPERVSGVGVGAGVGDGEGVGAGDAVGDGDGVSDGAGEGELSEASGAAAVSSLSKLGGRHTLQAR